MTENSVPLPPQGVVLALQFWSGDFIKAMRLARLLADIEPKRRSDVTLAFCPRFDVLPSALQWETQLYVGHKFGFTEVKSRREGTGHPRGCNQLAAGVMDALSEAWWAGRLSSHSAFMLEADGVPMRADWLDIVLHQHALAIEAGKRVTGALTNHGLRHINGSLMAHLSLWQDRPSLRETPSDQAWDLFHAAVLTGESRPTSWIKNVYAAGAWSDASLAGMAKETAWLCSSKDESALSWSERTLVQRKKGA